MTKLQHDFVKNKVLQCGKSSYNANYVKNTNNRLGIVSDRWTEVHI